MHIIFTILILLAVIVCGLLLHAMMQLEHLRTQPPPLFLYGFHEDGTPIEGWHNLMKDKK